MHVPKRLPSEEIAICEQIFRRALHRIDAELPGLVEALFGSGASLSELHTLDELEFSFNEPAINVYFAGGGFTPHEDSCALTVLIPLTSAADGAFAGGGTGFWGRRSSAARGDEPSLVLKPQPGTAMLFTGDVTHAGLPVATGTRVVLVASFSRRVAAGAGEMPADGVGEEQLVFEGGEQLVRKVFPGGTVQYYGGEREVQRLVRVEYPDGDVEHYGGERGAERMVRAVLSNGDVEHYEGEADSERLVRRELPNGRPDRLTHTSNSSGASGAEDASSSSSTCSAESIGENSSDKPFACAVRIVVRGQTVEQALEQGKATVREVQASLVRGPVATSTKKLMPGSQHYVLWTNLGPRNSLRVQPEKSNSIVWLNKADAAMSEFDPKNPWPVQRALIEKELPHARSWVDVLEHAREDGGIDIKDDCRLEDRSARLHQDGNNFMKRGARPLVRLAINVSSASSGRSLDYLELSAMEKGFVDGAERDELLVFSVSQDQMWHGAAQTTSGYVQGISEVCHCSSAGQGPCLKRIITVFALPDEHPLSALTAVQRLQRIGIEVHAIEQRHQLGRPRPGG